MLLFRCFEEVHQGQLWEWLQRKVRRRDPGGVLAALQLYSDKTLLNLKGESVFPFSEPHHSAD